MKFSVCIPNYNYARWIGQAVESILAQSHQELEVVVADNASTDGSADVIREIANRDDRVKLRVNNCNVGFAGNIDRSIRPSTGEKMLVFPSDDVMLPGCIQLMAEVFRELGPAGERAILDFSVDVIDAKDNVTGELGVEHKLYRASDRDRALEDKLGVPVYSVPADELLRRCLSTMKNPFILSTAVYARALCDKIEGYGGGRVINPDKWFHWRLLSVAERVYFIDRRVAQARWHQSNQTFQEVQSGALKFLVDDYVSSFELDKKILERLGLTRADLERSYIEHDIARHGLATLARGDREKASRIFTFGAATYPAQVRRSKTMWAFASLLALGPLGTKLAGAAYKRYAKP